jgi:tetratricopeptide (TPR) repeat protein
MKKILRALMIRSNMFCGVKKAIFFLLFSLISPGLKAQADIDSMMKKWQKQIDSALNDPDLKKILKDAKAIDADSLKRAVQSSGATPSKDMRAEDSSSYRLPDKKSKALAGLPKKTLSTAELKTFITNIDKKLAPVLHASFGTPIANTDAYDANTIVNSAVFALAAGLVDQAVLLSLKAVEKAPDDPVVLNNTGAILKKGGLEIAAIPVLEAALEKDPGNSTIQNNLGQSYLSLGDRVKAEQYLQQCVGKAIYHPLANSSLALIYLERGNKQTAFKYTENSLRGSFTDRAWHLLLRLKPDAVLMDYMRQRYEQPEYFNENKYKLPLQCEKVSDMPAMKAEYKAYHDMIETVENKFKAIASEENEKGMNEMVENAKNGRIKPPPFMELAGAMMLDIKLRMDKNGWDEIARSQKRYHARIKVLQDEYKTKYRQLTDCGPEIALANEYMEKMSVVTHEYQKTYLRVYKDFYHDMAYWSLLAAPNEHLRKGVFCGQTASLLGVLSQIAETHFLDLTIDCASNEELKKEAEEIEIEGHCPIGGGEEGYEIPFGIGKLNVGCEKVEFQFGEALVLNVGHKFSTGETTWALGPGVSLSLVGATHESIKKVPQLKFGPIQGGLEAGIKAQVFLTFKDGALLDWGGVYTAEMDLLGSAKEFKTGYTLGVNSGLEMEPGPLRNAIDKIFGPEEEPQINKNIKKYKEPK